MEVRLVIVSPLKARKSYSVRLPLVVGRGEEAKFRIQQDSVSRRHCSFAFDGGAVYVTDLGSTNGTLVGGVKIEPHAAMAVSSGAEVQIGGTVLRVEYAVVAAAAAPAARDGDTVRVQSIAAAEPAELEPIAEALPELQPEEPVEPLPELEPVAESSAPPADAHGFPDGEPAAPSAVGSFDFLGAESPAPGADDDNLDDFFKSLS